MTVLRRGLLALATVLLVGVLAPPVASADDGEVTIEATFDDRDVEDAGAGDPIELHPETSSDVLLTVTNGTDEDITVRDVTLDGVVIGITFLAYDTDVNLEVPAGATEEVRYELPLRGLEDQAVGLVPATLAIHDAEGEQLASTDFTVDVAGSSSSLFARFGIFLAVVTAGTVLLNLWLVIRRRLPPNRVARGIRFAISGIGIGLTATVALAATRVLPPYASAWVPLLVVPTAGAFLLGLLSPGPLAHAWPEDEIDVAIRDTVRSAAET
jgi:hypothetical protein